MFFLLSAFVGLAIENEFGDLYPDPVLVEANPEVDEFLDEALETGEEPEGEGSEWLIAPIPSYSPTLGWTIAVPVTLLYHPSFVDAKNPVWATGGAGFYSDNGSWGAGLLHRMNLKDDTWRFLFALFHSDVNYKFYGVGGGAGNPDLYLQFGQRFSGGRAKVLRRLSRHLYFGLRATGFNSEIHTVRLPTGGSPDIKPPWFDIVVQVNTLTPVFVFDSRDNEFYPTKGHYGHLEYDVGDDSWGSDFDYQYFKFDWNHYRQLSDDGVLAMRFVSKYATGSTPFFLLPAMGQGGDLRGYPAGLYRDQFLIAGQVEYRHRLTDRIGFVVFGGLGGVAEDWDELDTALPSYGAGLRWVIAPKNDISLRVDYARGRDDHEIYVGVGEAF
jgi:hypothetical protein